MTSIADRLPGRVDDGPEALAPFARMARGLEAVVRPASADEAAEAFKWAAGEGVAVVPVGSGRHLPPRQVVGRAIVLSASAIDSIEVYEPADLTLTAGAGLSIDRLTVHLGEHGQWLPFDPPSFTRHTLGGLVASGRSGPMATGYGALRNHVLGATVVTGDGRILKLGGRVVKNVAGFDLLRPVVGSMGSVAFIASVSARVFPRPEVDALLIAEEASVAESLAVARRICTARVLPMSVVVDVPREGMSRVLVRLHGAEAAVEADARTFEMVADRALIRMDGPAVEQMSVEVRDAITDAPAMARASTLPSRLPALVSILGDLKPRHMTIDAYRGAVGMALDGDIAPQSWTSVRERVEASGGSLVLEAVASGVVIEPLPVSSLPRAAEIELGSAFRASLDPRGLLWGTRT